MSIATANAKIDVMYALLKQAYDSSYVEDQKTGLRVFLNMLDAIKEEMPKGEVMVLTENEQAWIKVYRQTHSVVKEVFGTSTNR